MPRVIQAQVTTVGADITWVAATDGTLWRIPNISAQAQTASYVQFPSLPQSTFQSIQSIEDGHFLYAVAVDGTFWRAVDLAAGTDSTQWKQLPALP